MKKVLIFSGYGSAVPDIITKMYDNKRTGEIIDKIEAMATTKWFSNTKALYDCVKENPDVLYRIHGTNSYVGWNKQVKIAQQVSIIEIDETKKWIIEEYDGAEFIRKLPEYELVDTELNLYAEKTT